jgi:hypothetical protein
MPWLMTATALKPTNTPRSSRCWSKPRQNFGLEFIDGEIFHNPSTPLDHARLEPWEGSSTTLETRLVNPPSKIVHEARKLLAWQNSCGTYLGRLEDSENEHITGRVTSRKHHGQTIWTIQPPQCPDPLPENADNAEPDVDPVPPPLPD